MAGNPGKERYKKETCRFGPNARASQQYTAHWLLPYIRRAYIQEQLTALTAYNIPALLIWGEDDRMGDPTGAMGYQASQSGVTCISLEQAGHCPVVDQPEIFFGCISDFVER